MLIYAATGEAQPDTLPLFCALLLQMTCPYQLKKVNDYGIKSLEIHSWRVHGLMVDHRDSCPVQDIIRIYVHVRMYITYHPRSIHSSLLLSVFFR